MTAAMNRPSDELGPEPGGATTAGDEGRRVVPEAEERTTLRLWLMDRYRADRRYQWVVQQDLNRLWRRVTAAPGWQDDLQPISISFMDIVHQLTLFERRVPEPPASAPTLRYVQAVARTVAVEMGLLDHDRPASWALQHVHDDVIGRARHARLLAVSPRAQDDYLSLRLDLTPNYVGVRYYPDAADAGTPPDQEFDLSTLGVGYAPAHWTKLEGIATGILRDAIAFMREDIENRHPFRNPTFIAKWTTDLDLLHRVLAHKHPPANRAEASRLRRLADRLGIDPPSQRRERGPLLPWSPVREGGGERAVAP